MSCFYYSAFIFVEIKEYFSFLNSPEKILYVIITSLFSFIERALTNELVELMFVPFNLHPFGCNVRQEMSILTVLFFSYPISGRHFAVTRAAGIFQLTSYTVLFVCYSTADILQLLVRSFVSS
jgi:hypothetical protein